jgi:hypothetical protein
MIVLQTQEWLYTGPSLHTAMGTGRLAPTLLQGAPAQEACMSSCKQTAPQEQGAECSQALPDRGNEHAVALWLPLPRRATHACTRWAGGNGGSWGVHDWHRVSADATTKLQPYETSMKLCFDRHRRSQRCALPDQHNWRQVTGTSVSCLSCPFHAFDMYCYIHRRYF